MSARMRSKLSRVLAICSLHSLRSKACSSISFCSFNFSGWHWVLVRSRSWMRFSRAFRCHHDAVGQSASAPPLGPCRFLPLQCNSKTFVVSSDAPAAANPPYVYSSLLAAHAIASSASGASAPKAYARSRRQSSSARAPPGPAAVAPCPGRRPRSGRCPACARAV